MQNPKDINWFAAPTWANWHVINASGKGMFLDEEPHLWSGSNQWQKNEIGIYVKKTGYFDLHKIHWTQTKEKRPSDIWLKSINERIWENAPEWANYFVCDLLYGIRGIGFFADTEPVVSLIDCWMFTGKFHQYAGQFDMGKKGWRETLIKRP